jgi:hypothetical protein
MAAKRSVAGTPITSPIVVNSAPGGPGTMKIVRNADVARPSSQSRVSSLMTEEANECGGARRLRNHPRPPGHCAAAMNPAGCTLDIPAARTRQNV